MLLVFAHVFVLQSLAVAMRIAIIYEGVALDIGTFWVGLIGGVFGLAPAVFALNIGHHIDRAGEKSALVWGSAICLAACALLALAPSSVAILFVGSLVLGFGQFMGIAGQQSAIARRGSAQSFGWMTMVVALAQTCGPLVVAFYSAGELLPDTGGVFLAGLWASAAALACAFAIAIPKSTTNPPSQGMLRNFRQILKTDGFILATTVSLVLFSAMELLVIFLPLYGAEHSIDAATIAFLLSVRGASSILSRLFFGPALKLLGRKTFIVGSLALAGVSIGCLTGTSSVTLMAAMLFLAGIGLGGGAPLSLSWLAEIVPAEVRGSAFAIRLSMNRFGQFLLPVAAGPLAGFAGAGSVLIAISASLVMGAVLVTARLKPVAR